MIVDDEDFHRDDFTVVLQPFMENIDTPRKVMVVVEIRLILYTSIAIRLQRSGFLLCMYVVTFAGKWKN